ncbi:MAG: 4'-phosphopantetheinyl transferase superfamily protein, partial [Spirochaetaceae bacterium]|nr:4'-phosphopantetheinyl transferase superfamily protein [Spirochaetaceae bacterium]
MVNMDAQAKLKAAIAKTLNIPESEISGAFSLDIQKFRSSAGTVILSNMVKKIYKQKINCAGIKTFGELVSYLEGTDVPTIVEQNGAEPLPPPVPVAAAPGSHVAPLPHAPPASISGTVSCGIDIQDISVFPVAEDYWTEPFYQEHFTGEEIAYCATAAFPCQHFAARWCVKEALRKTGPAFLPLPFNAMQVKKQQDGSV